MAPWTPRDAYNTKDIKGIKDIKDFKDIKDIKYTKDIKDTDQTNDADTPRASLRDRDREKSPNTTDDVTIHRTPHAPAC